MYLNKIIESQGLETEFPKFKDKKFVDLNLTTTDLFLSQYHEKDFNAVDIAVKSLAIDQFYGNNDFGFDMYNKMQKFRINEDWQKRFEKLIISFEDSGINEKSKLETDLNYELHDGSHRLALSLFHNIDEVPVRIYNLYAQRREYDINWFLNNNFSKKEINEINKKLDELFNKSKKTYYCLIWPPARNIYQSVERAIPKVEDGISIVESKDLLIPNSELKDFIYNIYKTDDIQKYKLDLKYAHMMESLKKDQYNVSVYPVKALGILLDNPDFRLKPLSGFPQSKTTMRIKKQVRGDFSDYVTDYYYDIIMHITDNQKQNNEVSRLIKKYK